MEKEPIIPTRHKSKITNTLSYPVGAKTISQALIGVPQFSELAVEFQFWNRHARLHGTSTPYRVIRAQFSGPRRSSEMPKEWREKELCRPKWIVDIDAVPRSLRHAIRSKIISEALPFIRSWLLANPHSIEREGQHRLEFTYDELKGELKCDEHASMEWQTARVE